MFKALFQSFCKHEFFYIFEFTNTSSADKTVRKSAKILQLFGFLPELEPFRLQLFSRFSQIEERDSADQSLKKSLEALQEDLRKERLVVIPYESKNLA